MSSTTYTPFERARKSTSAARTVSEYSAPLSSTTRMSGRSELPRYVNGSVRREIVQIRHARRPGESEFQR